MQITEKSSQAVVLESLSLPTAPSDDLTLIRSFVDEPDKLFETALKDYPWQTEIKSRRTASFGVPYTSSHIAYPERMMPQEICILADMIERIQGWRPNNCLINHYASGSNSMGFHSDDTRLMEPGTGVAIISLGAERTISFRNISDPESIFSVSLPAGSLLHMTAAMQKSWQHAIEKDIECKDARISLTFRKIPSHD